MVAIYATLQCAVCAAALLRQPGPELPRLRSGGTRVAALRMQTKEAAGEAGPARDPETDLNWFYGEDDYSQTKAYSDYEWDPEHPGSLKPGLRKEKYDIDIVMEMWKDKENATCMRLPMDEVCARATVTRVLMASGGNRWGAVFL